MKDKKPVTTIFIKNVPRNTKSHFKAWCAKREKTMSLALIDFMKEMVSKADSHDN